MNDKRILIIQQETISEAEKIYEYIKENSPQNAEKFRQEFLNSVNEVESNPDIYSPVNELNVKRILYRFKLVMKSWKLIYKVTPKSLIFIGIIHTSRHTNEIKKLRTTS